MNIYVTRFPVFSTLDTVWFDLHKFPIKKKQTKIFKTFKFRIKCILSFFCMLKSFNYIR